MTCHPGLNTNRPLTAVLGTLGHRQDRIDKGGLSRGPIRPFSRLTKVFIPVLVNISLSPLHIDYTPKASVSMMLSCFFLVQGLGHCDTAIYGQ